MIDFKANELRLNVNVRNDSGAWLYYADAWHPDWKAFVNEKEVSIAKANIAFKAVKLDRGSSQVRFVFSNKNVNMCAIVLAFSGALFIFL